jgi:hypothetical protein
VEKRQAWEPTPDPQPTKHLGDGDAAFSDAAGRRWRLKISVATVRKIRQQFGLDLLQILDRTANPFVQLSEDPFRLCDVVWSLIASQAAEAGVVELEWLDAMAGDCLTDAAYALMEATIDFFPQHRRNPLRAMLTKMKRAEISLTERMTKLAESAQTDEAIEAELTKAETAATSRLQTELNRLGA